jgi:rubrerythrin
MNLEETLKTAVEYETRIRDLYRELAEQVKEEAGKQFFTSLAADEENHIAYLLQCLGDWREKGVLPAKGPVPKFSPLREMKQSEADIRRQIPEDFLNDEKEMISRALKAEIETSRFYESMMESAPDQAKRLFQRFMEIENEHVQLVRAQLDHATQTGYWFGIKEFDME